MFLNGFGSLFIREINLELRVDELEKIHVIVNQSYLIS